MYSDGIDKLPRNTSVRGGNLAGDWISPLAINQSEATEPVRGGTRQRVECRLRKIKKGFSNKNLNKAY